MAWFPARKPWINPPRESNENEQVQRVAFTDDGALILVQFGVWTVNAYAVGNCRQVGQWWMQIGARVDAGRIATYGHSREADGPYHYALQLRRALPDGSLSGWPLPREWP